MDRADSLGVLMVVPAILVARGSLEEARGILGVFKRFESSHDVQERAAHAVARATVEAAGGRFGDAHTAAREAVDLDRRVGPDGHMFRMGLEQAMESALALGDLAEVEALLAIVHDLRRAEITPMLRAIALRSRARLDAIAGRIEAVEAGLTNAAALFREIGQYRGSGRSSKISATGSSLRGETGRLRLSWRSQETSTSVWRLNPRRRVIM